MTRKFSILAVLILFGIAGIKAQNLDRISISSGGSATDEVNYVLGETFNFTMADGANVIIETGTLGSTDDTGGDNNFTVVKQLAQTTDLECYPNPTTDIVNITGLPNASGLILSVYNISGKVVKMQSCTSKNMQSIDVSNLTAGTYFISVSDIQLKSINSVKFVKQ